MKRKRLSKINIMFLVLDFLALIVIFIAYGPFSFFRNFLVTTAMGSMSHHYFARTIYSDKMIAETLSNNYVLEVDSNTNTDDINFNNDDSGNYESIYEEQILKRDPDNDLYKIIEINENGSRGYMAVIYDPSRISLVNARKLEVGGQKLSAIATENEALVAINASGLYNIGGNAIRATGTVIKDGKIFSVGGSTGFGGGGLIGFNYDNVLVLTKESASSAIKNGMRDAVEFGPFLIVNGEEATIVGNGGYGIAPRTAIAQRKDGIVLFLVIDGRQAGYSIGATMNDLIKILKRYKAHNAANLDGGGSSVMAIDGKIINKPAGYSYTGERYLVNSWVLK